MSEFNLYSSTRSIDNLILWCLDAAVTLKGLPTIISTPFNVRSSCEDPHTIYIVTLCGVKYNFEFNIKLWSLNTWHGTPVFHLLLLYILYYIKSYFPNATTIVAFFVRLQNLTHDWCLAINLIMFEMNPYYWLVTFIPEMTLIYTHILSNYSFQVILASC